MTKGGRWRAAAGVVISLGLIAWALRGVSIREITAQLRGASMLLFFAATACATAIFALRAAKWRVILEPIAPDVSLGACWRATTIGMMANNLLPARAGELARALALTREDRRIGIAPAVASLAVDRVFDAVVLLALAILAVPGVGTTAGVGARSVTGWVAGAAALSFGLVASLYVLLVFPEQIVRVFSAFAGWISRALAERGERFIRDFATGLDVLRSPRRFTRAMVWTVAHWLLNAAAFWLGFKAVGIDVPFTAALLVQAIVAFGVAVPAAPGFFGVFEALSILALGLYGVDRLPATSFAIGFHVLTFIPVTILGLIYAARLGLGPRALGATPAPNGS